MEKTYTEKDNGKDVSLQVDETFFVELKGNPGTGYHWYFVKNNCVKQVGKPTSKASCADDVIGGSTLYTFEFQLVNRPTVLELEYKRIFEKKKPPIKTFKLNIG